MINKKELINGRYYIGHCRNTNIAKWDNGVFIFIATIFKTSYIGSIEHFDDSKKNGLDGFIPMKMIDLPIDDIIKEKHAVRLYNNLNPISMKGERFVTIAEFPNYAVSNYGRVKNITTNKIKVQSFNQGYLVTGLIDNNKKVKSVRIHRFVAMAFITNLNKDKIEVNHINGIKTDNSSNNLEWMTRSENASHIYHSGIAIKKLSKAMAIEIKQLIADGKHTQKEIAELYKVGQSLISDIKNGKLWRNV